MGAGKKEVYNFSLLPSLRGVVLYRTYSVEPGERASRSFKGVAQIAQQAIAGPLAALSLTPMHSLRHRLVRSRQSAHEDVLGFLRF